MKHLEGKVYDNKFHSRWSDGINESAIDALARAPRLGCFPPARLLFLIVWPRQTKMAPNFKFMVSVLLVQKRPIQHFCTESVAYWNENTDGFVHHQWRVFLCRFPPDARPRRRENRSLVCIAHVFASAL